MNIYAFFYIAKKLKIKLLNKNYIGLKTIFSSTQKQNFGIDIHGIINKMVTTWLQLILFSYKEERHGI
ncbi:MAG TPA: hypothetical protein DCL31_03835 [Clostridium sp.]|nr:hypothetical protein [Clostridium sp.]